MMPSKDYFNKLKEKLSNVYNKIRKISQVPNKYLNKYNKLIPLLWEVEEVENKFFKITLKHKIKLPVKYLLLQNIQY